jgi:hypothetical protein
MAKPKEKDVKAFKAKVKVLEDGRLTVFTAVKGLVKDGNVAAGLVEKMRPDILALGIAPEDLKGLRYLRKRLEKKKKYTPDLSNIDLSYVDHLSKYGDVDAPPPCFSYALETADNLDIPVVTLDLDNLTHTDIYVKNVLFSDLLRQSMRFRFMKKKKFKIKTAEEFVMVWDTILNKARGFTIVERSREEFIAESLRYLLDHNKGKNVLAIIELERSKGIIDLVLHPPTKKSTKNPQKKVAAKKCDEK